MFPQLKKRLPLAALVLIALLGWAGAAALWAAAGRTEQLRFASVADEALNRIGARLRLHLLLIEATAAIIEAQGDALTAPRFAEYFSKLQLAERYPGIAGLGYAPLLTPEELPALAARLEANYGRPVQVWPENSSEDKIAPVVLLGSPDPDPPQAVGFDMYSEATRRIAIETAIAARAPRASGPLRLATDKTPMPGFIVFAPIYADSFGVDRRAGPSAPPTGFAFGGFRTGELAGAALQVAPFLPVALSIADADAPDDVLYAYGAPADWSFGPSHMETRSLEVAGQTWTLTLRPSDAFEPGMGRRFAVAFGAICTAFAAAGGFGLREQERARSAAEALAAASARNATEKDLLLQEMKHRIKNAIARILAIARQTAKQSDDLGAFTASFTQRLQAMAEAQDMLTRSAAGSADLAELLTRELVQVFGAEFDPSKLRGEPVELDAARTQALGLVFHELATNALKYGGAEGCAPHIEVSWKLTRGAAPALDLHWVERGGRVAPPERTGFGTRLIDASIRQELGGGVTRDWRPGGLDLRLRVPLAAG